VKRTKTMGVIVAMALALTAFVGVSSASADLFKTGAEPAKWNGSRLGKNHVLSVGEVFECQNVSFSGETTKHTNETLTVTPELSSCVWLGVYSVNWQTNGCKFRFHAAAGPNTVDIVGCTAPMSFEAGGCRITIGKQNGLGPVSYTNVGSGSTRTITMAANLTGMAYTASGTCLSGLKGTFYNGTYTGEWTVKSTTSSGVQVETEIESAPTPPVSQFVAQEGPATVSATAAAKFFSLPQGQGLSCKSSGSTELVSPEATSLTFAPAISECNMDGSSASASMGACSFKYLATGSLEIVGASCAANPITFTNAHAGVECTVTVGPQGPLSGLNLFNEGSGRNRIVRRNATSLVEGVKYTATGAHCNGTGTFSDGAYKQNLEIKATNSKGAAQGLWLQ
jgi:hypothetical protein